LVALVAHRAPEVGLAEVRLGLVGLGFGEPVVGDPVVGDRELGDGYGKAEVAFGLGDVFGECGVALGTSGPQPASTTMVADIAIAGQIRFRFMAKLLYLFETNVKHWLAS
jgi:hypothetical protein